MLNRLALAAPVRGESLNDSAGDLPMDYLFAMRVRNFNHHGASMGWTYREHVIP